MDKTISYYSVFLILVKRHFMSRIYDIASQMAEKKDEEKLQRQKEMQDLQEKKEARNLQIQRQKIEKSRYRVAVIISVVAIIIALASLVLQIIRW